MSLRRIKHMFLRLSAEEKVIGAGGLLVIMGAFMPWFYIILFDQSTVYNGFGGDLGVIGFVIFILVLLAILNLIAEHLHISFPQFGYTKEQVLFFLMGQSAFLTLLTIAIYTKRSLDYTTSELRFGIYFALVGSFLGAFAAFAQIQKLKKKEVSDFFEHEEEEHIKKPRNSYNYEKEDEENQKPEEEQMLFEEEVEQEPELIQEDEMIEEIEELIREPKTNNDDDQGRYFSREAGINSEADNEIDDFAEDQTEPEEIEEESDKSDETNDKKNPGLSMNFYEDN
ncbi:hypothetical protein JW758_01580 [Candidatus Peregrinibacteria bacterium]|nr:hypothetical protein [Candidatus Peregrinibacteria bacterium]